MTARSYLYVPGDSGRRLEHAHERGADAVIADLEDGVAAAGKPAAVAAVRTWLAGPAQGRVERWVRINAGELGCADVRVVAGPGLTGVCIPKVGDAADVGSVVAVLDELYPGRQRPAVMALVETARGLRRIDEIAAVPGLTLLQLGELDLSADLGLAPGPDELELLPARATVVAASAAAGLRPPVGPVAADFADLVRFAASTAALQRLGFGGRAVIHPAQLAAVHETFTPRADEVERAADTLRRYDAALAAGTGVARDAGGAMIDEAVARSCRRVLESAR